MVFIFVSFFDNDLKKSVKKTLNVDKNLKHSSLSVTPDVTKGTRVPLCELAIM